MSNISAHQTKNPTSIIKEESLNEDKPRPLRKTPLPKITSKKSLSIHRACFLVFMYYISISCINPFRSLIFKNAFDLSSSTIGWLSAINSLSSILATPIWVRIMKHIGDGDPSTQLNLLLITYTVSVLLRLSQRFTYFSFELFVAFQIVKAFFYAPCKSFVDGVVMSSLPDEAKSKYGQVRFWGQFASGLSSSLIVTIIGESSMGFDVIFLVHAILSIPTLLYMFSLKPIVSTLSSMRKSTIGNKSAPTNHITVISLLKNGDARIIFLFGIILLIGFTYGFMESFTYVHIGNLYSTSANPSSIKKDMFICRVLISSGGMIMYWFSERIHKRFNSENIMLICAFCAGMASLLYGWGGLSYDHSYHADNAIITVVHWKARCCIFAAEAIRGAVYACFWSTVMVYANRISPHDATMFLWLEWIYKGIGHTSGSVIGGRLVSIMGGYSPSFIFVGRLIVSIIGLAVTSSFYSSSHCKRKVKFA